MRTTAKVTVARKEDAGDDQTQLTFSADYADGRNKEWAKYTPYLQVVMVVKNSVAEHFEVGGRFILTFEPEED
jgi:hypothetical protein